MPRVRRRFDAKFKSRVALEAVRVLKAISEIAKQFKVHPNQVTLWKKQLLEGAEGVFEGSVSSGKKSDNEPESGELYAPEAKGSGLFVASSNCSPKSQPHRPSH